MSQEVPQSSVIRRLLQHRGRWLLEVESIELIDVSILRPVVRCAEGELAIVEELSKHAVSTELSMAAQRIMLTPTATVEDRAFRPHQDRWVQVAFTPPVGLALPRDVSPTELADHEHEHAETSKLTRTIEHLRARLKHLEAQASRGQQMEAHLADLVRRNALLDRRVEMLEARLASGPVPAAQDEERGSPDAEVAAAPAAEPAAQETRAVQIELPHPVHFPPADALHVSLQQLVGDAVGLTELPRKAGPKLGPSSTGWYAAAMLDDQMRVAAAMLADAKAVIQIGGALMMLPAPEIQSQQRARTPSEDVTAAMSEVFNTLNAAVNLVADNPHTRTNYLEPLEFDRFPWLASPAMRLDLRETAGGGFVVLASRDPADMVANG
ncbi:MAG: hypothetical protein HY898_33900 [Deltaproteobacteria bacterium]|nr:hypothetical protein [Deltaproteobacteria bacterium]